MLRLTSGLTATSLIAAIGLAAGCTAPEAPTSNRYEDLVALFGEWREFQEPEFVNGVPDYSAQAMAAQHRQLAAYQARLAAIDTTAWPVARQVDYHLVRAEMNGLDFDHRVLRPWARNPAFYTMIFPERSDVPAHEGPVMHGWIDLWTYDFPLPAEGVAELTARLGTIPAVLDQARDNLGGNARDLWMGGIRGMAGQSADLEALAARVAGTSAELEAAVRSARAATDGFRTWLEGELPSKTGPSGVGIENYNWFLANVQLVPYTWAEEVTIMRRELARAHASLRLEEHRNRDVSKLARIASAQEYDRRLNAAVTEFMTFLRDREIVSVRDYMDGAMRERIGRFTPAEGLRGFFDEVSYRDPLTMRTHSYHWIELARMENEPHASVVRRMPLLYNIFAARSEGLATAMEEMMMHAGLFEGRPRSRELVWILLAQRAARALSGLYMHSNDFTIEEAVEYASAWTPRGWLPTDGNTVWGEQSLYLQQPFYGSSYLIGKLEIERLMADRARQLGDDFTLRRFMDEFTASGVIPVSLIRWELTGEAHEIVRMAGGPLAASRAARAP